MKILKVMGMIVFTKYMKALLLFSALLGFSTVIAQTKFPEVIVYTADGIPVNTKTFKSNQPLIIDFWGSYCKPCIIKYNALSSHLPSLKQKGVRFIAIAVDKTEAGIRSAKARASKNNWPYEIYYDQNNVLFEKLSDGPSVPQTFFYDSKLELISKSEGADVTTKTGNKHADTVFNELYQKQSDLNEFGCDLTGFFEKVDKITAKKEIK